MNAQLRNRILLAAGAIVASVAMITGVSIVTAAVLEASRPVPEKAAVIYPTLPQPEGHESAEAFAQRAFGTSEPASLRAAAALVYTQRGIQPQVAQALEDWPTWNEDSVIADPLGIAQTRALIIFAAACRQAAEQRDGFEPFTVAAGFAPWSRSWAHETKQGWVTDRTASGGISSADCEAAISESAEDFDLSRLDPGLDTAAVFDEFNDNTTRKILLGLNGQLPTSR